MSQPLTIVHAGRETGIPRKLPQGSSAGQEPGVGLSTATRRTFRVGVVAVSGQRVLMTTDSSGTVSHADPSLPPNAARIVGISVGAAYAGAEVQAQWDDVLTDPGFAFDLTKRIFCGANGVLVQTPPASGFARCVGQPITPTSMRVDINPPIFLA